MTFKPPLETCYDAAFFFSWFFFFAFFFFILEESSHAAILLILTDSVKEHQMTGGGDKDIGEGTLTTKMNGWKHGMQTFVSHGLLRIVSGQEGHGRRLDSQTKH